MFRADYCGWPAIDPQKMRLWMPARVVPLGRACRPASDFARSGAVDCPTYPCRGRIQYSRLDRYPLPFCPWKSIWRCRYMSEFGRIFSVKGRGADCGVSRPVRLSGELYARGVSPLRCSPYWHTLLYETGTDPGKVFSRISLTTVHALTVQATRRLSRNNRFPGRAAARRGVTGFVGASLLAIQLTAKASPASWLLQGLCFGPLAIATTNWDIAIR